MLKHGSADILSSLGFCIPTVPLGSTWEITTANSDHYMVACERNWRVPGDKDPNLASRIPPLNPPPSSQAHQTSIKKMIGGLCHRQIIAEFELNPTP
ncbi:hypothetical protein FPSE_11730 [Fusarium pseudograminearum CS3096]|uniref:Uncharacterized protein n=1 Tax=Fusarium pseudograminearum (strain CS3096) TaxID=1028729 RepID=K3VX19_FUSPC|nr:hypothetical protein FPSE_11730 [Fusarium pseudograminearum CS3096]EKJ68130.1 hypothetical protein FPSE_11730 [Fusarium pseudograminearum CS3096]